MKDVAQITKIFLERFQTLGQGGFYASSDEIAVLGKHLKNVGKDMGIDDNYELLELFAGIYAYIKMGKEFSEWAEKL